MIRADLAKSLSLRSRRFGIEPELVARLAQADTRIFEVPISYHGRTYAEGKKITWRDGVAAFWHILRSHMSRPKKSQRLSAESGAGMARSSQGPGARLWPFLAIAVLAILALHGGVYFRDGLHADRMLQDTDGYMWLNRVVHLHETGDWFDHTYPRINPPEGHVQHWTRPFDAVLLAGGAVVGSVVGFEQGLYYWSLAMTPLMHLLTLALLIWGVRPLVHRRLLPGSGIPMLILVFLAQVGVYQPFFMGRPDHHAPMALLFVAYLGFLLRILLDRRRGARSAVGLGLISAFALWVLVEALVFVVLGMLALGLSWLFGNNRIARLSAIHGATLFVGVVAAWLVEWGPRALQVRAVDTLSLAHVGLFGFTALFWAFLWWASDRRDIGTVPARAAVAGVGAIAALGGTFAVFPEFLGSPFGQVDPLLAGTWLFNIDELQPMLAGAGDVPSVIGRLALLAGIAIAALPWIGVRLVRTRDRDVRIVWLVFAVAIAFFLVMTLQQRRWTDYLALSAVIPFTLMALALLDSMGRRLRGAALTAARPVARLGLVFGPILLAVVLGTGFDQHTAMTSGAPPSWGATDVRANVTVPVAARNPAQRTCDLARIAEVLEDPAWFPQRALIMAHADHGPELLYRTRSDVLSITNHRRQPGYALTWSVLSDTDIERAAAALHGRGVDAAVLCLSDLATGFILLRDREESFLRYLVDGGVPPGYELHASTQWWRIYRRVEVGL
jgi:hypothetical protein